MQISMSARLVTIVRVQLHVVIPTEVTPVCVQVGTPNLVNMAAQILTNVRRPPPIVVTSSTGRVVITPVDMDVLVTKDSLETDLFVQI